MSVLLMRLTGPMQSWGTRSRFTNRDTGLEPSKSGVVGILCSALGLARDAESVTRSGIRITLADVAALRMAVRIDHEGRVCRDYQTAGGARRGHYGVAKSDGSRATAVLSNRLYLADAEFVVGLEGNAELVSVLDAALSEPVWQLFLGRKSFAPAWPVRVGVSDEPLLQALASVEYWKRGGPPEKLRLVLEVDYGTTEDIREDQPLGFDATTRRHGHCTIRHVETRFLPDDKLGLGLPKDEAAPWPT